MYKNKIEAENMLFANSLLSNFEFTQACKDFVDSIEEPDGYDELSTTTNYVPYGNTMVVESVDFDEQELFELQQKEAIEQLKDGTVTQIKQFDFFINCLNEKAVNYEDCVEIMNLKAIKIIEEL